MTQGFILVPLITKGTFSPFTPWRVFHYVRSLYQSHFKTSITIFQHTQKSTPLSFNTKLEKAYHSLLLHITYHHTLWRNISYFESKTLSLDHLFKYDTIKIMKTKVTKIIRTKFGWCENNAQCFNEWVLS